MPDRFYLPGDWSAEPLRLEGSELQHLSRVLRKRAGELIEIFNGKGMRGTARIESISRQFAELSLTEPAGQRALPVGDVELLASPPKGDRFRWMVEKCVELGVARIVPVRTTRSVVDPRDSKLHKLDQVVIAACKQCGRDWLMPIDPVADLRDLITELPATPQRAMNVVGDIQGEVLGGALVSWSAGSSGPDLIRILVGPEGGFTEEEQAQIDAAGFHRVRASPFVLRIETAALALAAQARGLFDRTRSRSVPLEGD